MILKSLRMQNFRQFRGVHEIRFASETETPGRNVTVLFGENGRGKTGIFRAIVFCLFGARNLSQDGEALERELALVNTSAIRDAGASGRGPVEAAVELAFSHRGCTYDLRRALRAVEHRGRFLEELKEVRLTLQDAKGNTRVVSDPQEVADHIASVLDPRVSEYFLFDGEKIERLTRASAQQRREVAKGIKDLLNIDALESAIGAMRALCRELDSEIRNKSTGEHARVIKQINENEDHEGRTAQRLSEIDRELEEAEEEKRQVDKELETYREIRDLLEERQRQETQQAATEDQLAALLADMRNRAARTATNLIEDTLRRVLGVINEKRQKGEIPPEIRADLIEKILAEQKCICGRAVRPDTEPHVCILEWKARTGDQEVSDTALELWRLLSTTLARVEDTRVGTSSTLQRYANARHQLQKIRERLEAIAEQIGKSERADAAKLEEHRRRIETKVVGLVAERQRHQQDIAILQAELETLKALRKRLEHDAGIRDELIQRAELAQSAQAALEEVFGEFRTEITVELASRATAILDRLLDAESRVNLKQVVVNDDYSLQVLDRWDQPFLANISAGQRQIMSISFIAALAQAAAGGKMLEMPLFMDTPFGRLSFEHRKNLIVEVPTLCAQWILLATDTELRQPEGTLLLRTERWGKFYLLRAARDGSTRVEERRPADALAVLLGEERQS
jgi:DNA sulfur modification protein DndD